MDNVSNYIIIGICMIILISFLIWVSWVDYTTKDNTIVYLSCAPSECAVNIYNGEKRCSVKYTDVVIYDPSFENCTKRYSCDSSLVPYAINSDGSTNDYGECEPGVTCRCAANPQCPLGEVVLFNIVSGNIYANNSTENDVIFNQIPVQNQGDTQPIVYTDPNVNFCSIPVSYLNRISPGTCVFPNVNAITTAEALSCIRSNPCVLGVMAFKPIDPTTFSLTLADNSSVYRVPVGCVSALIFNGVSAECVLPNQVAVWDPDTANIFCYTVV